MDKEGWGNLKGFGQGEKKLGNHLQKKGIGSYPYKWKTEIKRMNEITVLRRNTVVEEGGKTLRGKEKEF